MCGAGVRSDLILGGGPHLRKIIALAKWNITKHTDTIYAPASPLHTMLVHSVNIPTYLIWTPLAY